MGTLPYLSWLPSPLSWEFRTHPQGRRVSSAEVAGRARIKNMGLGFERGSG